MVRVVFVYQRICDNTTAIIADGREETIINGCLHHYAIARFCQCFDDG